MNVNQNYTEAITGITVAMSTVELTVLKTKWEELTKDAIDNDGEWKSRVTVGDSRRNLLEELNVFMEKFTEHAVSLEQAHDELFKIDHDLPVSNPLAEIA